MERVEFVGRASLAVSDVISCPDKMLLENKTKVGKGVLFLFSFERIRAHEQACVIRCVLRRGGERVSHSGAIYKPRHALSGRLVASQRLLGVARWR